MFRFRGQRKDNGEWVVGRYIILGSQHYIYHYNGKRNGFAEIHPHTLSISTGKLDSKEQEIFASFRIDGVMTAGGDVVKQLGGWTMNVCYDKLNSCFSVVNAGNYAMQLSGFYPASLTIIGKQGGGSE